MNEILILYMETFINVVIDIVLIQKRTQIW